MRKTGMEEKIESLFLPEIPAFLSPLLPFAPFCG
jgi:hypothetical protein